VATGPAPQNPEATAGSSWPQNSSEAMHASEQQEPHGTVPCKHCLQPLAAVQRAAGGRWDPEQSLPGPKDKLAAVMLQLL
jgi:hypothetical protein